MVSNLRARDPYRDADPEPFTYTSTATLAYVATHTVTLEKGARIQRGRGRRPHATGEVPAGDDGRALGTHLPGRPTWEDLWNTPPPPPSWRPISKSVQPPVHRGVSKGLV